MWWLNRIFNVLQGMERLMRNENMLCLMRIHTLRLTIGDVVAHYSDVVAHYSICDVVAH